MVQLKIGEDIRTIAQNKIKQLKMRTKAEVEIRIIGISLLTKEWDKASRRL